MLQDKIKKLKGIHNHPLMAKLLKGPLNFKKVLKQIKTPKSCITKKKKRYAILNKYSSLVKETGTFKNDVSKVLTLLLAKVILPHERRKIGLIHKIKRYWI